MSVDLREKDFDVLRLIFLRFPSVRSVRIFGSRARGVARRASDLDLAVIAPGISDREWSELRHALDEAPLIYNLDIVRFDALKDQKLRARIEADGVEVFVRRNTG